MKPELVEITAFGDPEPRHIYVYPPAGRELGAALEVDIEWDWPER